jgi:hypothetical protein
VAVIETLGAAIGHPLAMLLYGMAANLLAALAQASTKGKPVNPIRFVAERPYRIALGVVAGLAGYGALDSTGQLTAVAAFGVGYMGTDVLQRIADAAGNRLAGK